MLARLELDLSEDRITYRNSSLLQGVLFEHISPEYASVMHSQSMHPYSQSIFKTKEGKTVWVICTLSKTAYENIIFPLLDPGFDKFHIEKKDMEIFVSSKRVHTLDKKQLLKDFYEGEAESQFNLSFLTATSFKQNGNSFILPDVRLIFQNLMNRYSACSENVDMWDEDTLDKLTESVFVKSHHIRSVSFPLESIYLPGFIGDVTLRVKGTDTLKRYVNFLLTFAEYSGIGMKTSMGMGAVRRGVEKI